MIKRDDQGRPVKVICDKCNNHMTDTNVYYAPRMLNQYRFNKDGSLRHYCLDCFERIINE